MSFPFPQSLSLLLATLQCLEIVVFWRFNLWQAWSNRSPSNRPEVEEAPFVYFLIPGFLVGVGCVTKAYILNAFLVLFWQKRTGK